MSISFIHIADVHLGSPLVASSEKKQQEINTAIERTLSNVVDIAIEANVDFIVIAGDLFDGSITNASLAAKFIEIMSPATEHKIHIYVLWGNHDAEGKHNLSFTDDEYLHFFPSNSPTTFMIKDKNIALHGQSFATQAVTENLAAEYPEKVDDAFNIGVLHTSLNGREDHGAYAPCSLHDLTVKEYDYWALGHIHKKEIVHESNPTIIFSGNLQGRHTKEKGEKGCFLVTVDEQHKVEYQFKALSSITFMEETLDIDGMNEAVEVIEKIRTVFTKNDNSAYLRLTFEGRTILSPVLENRMFETIKLELLNKNITLSRLKNKTNYPKTPDEIAEEQNTVGKMVSILHNDSIQNEVALIVEEELGHFEGLADYMPDNDSLYALLLKNASSALDTIVLEQLQKNLK